MLFFGASVIPRPNKSQAGLTYSHADDSWYIRVTFLGLSSKQNYLIILKSLWQTHLPPSPVHPQISPWETLIWSKRHRHFKCDSDPSSAMNLWCDLGQVPDILWAVCSAPEWDIDTVARPNVTIGWERNLLSVTCLGTQAWYGGNRFCY